MPKLANYRAINYHHNDHITIISIKALHIHKLKTLCFQAYANCEPIKQVVI